MRRTHLLLLLISLIFCSTAFANTLIEGTVLDTNGTPIQKCTITALNLASSEKFIAKTNQDGKYSFNPLAPGNYKLTASSSEYSDSVTEARLTSEKNLEINFKLLTGTFREEILVTATRNETDTLNTPESTTSLDSKKLMEGNYAGLGQVFATATGTSVLESGAFRSRPAIRGLNSNRILILLDGDRLNNSRTSTSNSGIELGLIDPGIVDSIEIVRGSGSVLYGTDALSGTINIITRDEPQPDDSFRLTGGLLSYLSSNSEGRRANGYLAGSHPLFSFRLAQSWEEFENYEAGDTSDADPDDLTGEILNSGFQARNTHIRGTLNLSDRQQLRAEYIERDGINVGVPGLAGSFSAYFPFDDLKKYRAGYEITNLSSVIARVSTRLYYQEQARNFTNILEVPGFFQFSETISATTSKGFDLQINMVPSENHLLILGASSFQDKNDDSRIIAFDPGIFERLDDEYRNRFSQPSLPEATFFNTATFAQDQFKLSDKIEILTGIRFDHFSTKSQPTSNFVVPPIPGLDLTIERLSSNANILSGNVGLVYELINGMMFTTRIGRSFREPNLFERFFTGPGSVGGFIIPNPGLKPESGWNVDTGIKFRKAQYTGSFTYFNNTFSDFISTGSLLDANGNPVVINPSGQRPVAVSRNFNVDRARLQGIEGELSASFSGKFGFITPFVSVSYLRGDDLSTDQPLDFITPLKTVSGIKLQNRPDRLWFQYSFRNVSEQDRLTEEFLTVNGGPEEGFTVHDLRGGFRWTMLGVPCTTTLTLENLSDRYYAEQYVFAPSQGRTFTIGFSLNY